MREIKFRIWHKGKMISPGDGNCKEIYFDGLPWDEEVSGQLMQFTGIFDRHKREIFEGDIVSYDFEGRTIVDQVFYVLGGFRSGTSPKSSSIPLCCVMGMAEIVGNIFETPELLKCKST